MSIEHKNIFNEVTSFQELNINGEKMSKQKTIDDFTDEDKVEAQLDFWKFKDEKEVIGVFERWESDSYGEHPVIITSDDVELHLPNLTALNGKLKQSDISKGNRIKVVYLGSTKAKKSGRTYEDFDVFVK